MDMDIYGYIHEYYAGTTFNETEYLQHERTRK